MGERKPPFTVSSNPSQSLLAHLRFLGQDGVREGDFFTLGGGDGFVAIIFRFGQPQAQVGDE